MQGLGAATHLPEEAEHCAKMTRYADVTHRAKFRVCAGSMYVPRINVVLRKRKICIVPTCLALTSPSRICPTRCSLWRS